MTALPGETIVSHIVISSLLTEIEKKKRVLAYLNSSQVHLRDRETKERVLWLFGSVDLSFPLFPSSSNTNRPNNSERLASFSAAEQGGAAIRS